MRKFFNGIKDRLSINDPQSEPAAVPPLPNIYGRPYRQFPDTEDMYKYRKQRGVNLGEPFHSPSCTYWHRQCDVALIQRLL